MGMFCLNTHHFWGLTLTHYIFFVIQLFMDPGHCMFPKLFVWFSFTIYYHTLIKIHHRQEKNIFFLHLCTCSMGKGQIYIGMYKK
jgi:hypothetical protein